MIRSRLLEIPGWYCRWARVSRIETFRFFKNISPRSNTARDSYWRDERSPNAREFHLFFESNPWFSTIASFGLSRSLWIDLEKYMVLLLPFFPPPFFVLPSSYCFGIEIVGSGFYEFSIFGKWNRRYLCRIESRFWKEFNTKYLCDNLS